MEAAAAACRKGVYVCSTVRGLLPALRRALPAVAFVEIPSEDLRKGAAATEHWDRDESSAAPKPAETKLKYSTNCVI